MAENLIACRIESYGKFKERGWSHLPEIGIRHVEIPVPGEGEMEAVRGRLSRHGLAASSLQGTCEVGRPDVAELMRPQMRACNELGAKYLFVSVHAGDTERAAVWQRLRAVGDVAAEAGVTVVMETHPDLVTNGDVGRQTMQSVDHPNVRVNFDTANVYYYNHDVTSVGELQKVVDYVAAVHLKDTAGGYRQWNFPPLGRGVVDFAAVFRLLNARGFYGPFTMELEGIAGEDPDEAAQLGAVAESVEHLRRIGAMT